MHSYEQHKEPTLNPFRILGCTAVLVFLASFLWYKFHYLSDEQVASREQRVLAKAEMKRMLDMQWKAKQYLSGFLKDPGSAQFRHQYGPCGQVNSKNAFGAYTGYQRFIALSQEIVVLENESGLSAGEFQDMWRKLC